MKRILVVANTYYQLILAIQMNLTIFKNDSVVLLFSNHSKDSEVIFETLKDECVFSDVSYIFSKNIISQRTNIDRIIDFIDISFKKTNRYYAYISNIEDLFFDELICFNYNIDIIGLFSILSGFNENIKTSLYEEGILSYGVDFDVNYRRRIIKSIRHFRGKKDISDSFSNFYCYYPEIYSGNLKSIKVPPISSNSDCSRLLRRIFNLNSKSLSYEEKYIFFTSVYDFEGGSPIGEYDLVMKIANLVGRDNLLIKTHPRDNRNIYFNSGIKIDMNSSIPWEAIQLSKDFSDKVFLTATSGSVLAGSFMSEKPTKTWYLYKLCDIQNNSSAQYSAKSIESLVCNSKMQYVIRNVSIADKIEDIYE